MGLVLVEWNRASNFLRLGIDHDIDGSALEHCEHFTIERCYRFGLKSHGALLPIRSLQGEAMLDEIKLEFEFAILVRNWRGRQPTRVDVQRRVPPVILQRS